MNQPLFTIGEFSKVVGLTVKTLRHYHEQGVLTPAAIDDQTGYRYYSPAQIETARVIRLLRGMEFSLEDIRELLRHDNEAQPDDAELIARLERQREQLAARAGQIRKSLRSLDQFIRQTKQARSEMSATTYEIAEKQLPPLWIAGMRMKATYAECGRGFARIARRFGRYLRGPCFLLHYDSEYREEDADFEACFPLAEGTAPSRGAADQEISVRSLDGGRFVTLVHQGPYDTLGEAYARIFAYVKQRGYDVQLPTREVYLKGPGMIFKGNPRKYLTEIQLPIAGA